MTAAQAHRFYTIEYPSTQGKEDFFEEQRKFNVSRNLTPFLKGRILDYGCGPGGRLVDVNSEKTPVSAFDHNPAYVEYAVSHGLHRYDPESEYDCIFLSHTVEHWLSPFADLAALVSKNLAADGTVIIQVPLVDRLLLGARKRGFYEEVHLAHVWYFSVSTLSEIMRRLGFELVMSDRVTTCIFRRARSEQRRRLSGPATTRVLLMMIYLVRFGLVAKIVNRLNRSLNFIDLRFEQTRVC